MCKPIKDGYCLSVLLLDPRFALFEPGSSPMLLSTPSTPQPTLPLALGWRAGHRWQETCERHMVVYVPEHGTCFKQRLVRGLWQGTHAIFVLSLQKLILPPLSIFDLPGCCALLALESVHFQ